MDRCSRRVYLLGDLARVFGCSTANARSLADRGRLPIPAHRSVDGTRWWSEEDMAIIRDWALTRLRRLKRVAVVEDDWTRSDEHSVPGRPGRRA